MRERVIFFDLDYAMYNTGRFINSKIESYAQMYGRSTEEVTEKEHQAAELVISQQGHFIQSEYAKTLAALLGEPYAWQEISRVFEREEIHKSSVYSEVPGVLGSLAQKYRLGLFTQGDLDVQRVKFEKSGLSSFFEPELVLMFEEKLPQIPQVVQSHPVACALDDRVEAIEAWAEAGVPLVIRVRRGTYSNVDLPAARPNVHEVENLQQAYTIIESELA